MTPEQIARSISAQQTVEVMLASMRLQIAAQLYARQCPTAVVETSEGTYSDAREVCRETADWCVAAADELLAALRRAGPPKA
jgi:hypothetical protein